MIWHNNFYSTRKLEVWSQSVLGLTVLGNKVERLSVGQTKVSFTIDGCNRWDQWDHKYWPRGRRSLRVRNGDVNKSSPFNTDALPEYSFGLFLVQQGCPITCTRLRTNMEPENDGFRKGISSFRAPFSGSMLNFRECKSSCTINQTPRLS